MAITTTWSVQNMTHTASDGGVTSVIWNCVAQNSAGPETADAPGSLDTTYDASDAAFIPYEDLTEAGVLQWVWDSEDFDKTEIGANLIERVEAQIVYNATAPVGGVPWPLR
jgi:hypothetical protein